MLQNFKTDIIYYNTATDFELEFNLCGCCRMRLLNDKCDDKKTLLLSLSRAFSRSRVIILTAPLFDGSDIIKTVSTAIGNSVETLDAAAYNIKSDMAIEITKGATPLVTADGIFGGLIIESGPQTLIILTDNKAVRKNIMISLIHPYIEELSRGNVQPAEPETEETEQQIEEETGEEEYEEENLIIDSEPEKDTQEDLGYYTEGSNLITESPVEKETDDLADDYYSDEDFYIEEMQEKQNSKFYIALIIISSILLLTIAVLCFCIFFVPAQNAIAPATYLKEIFDTMFK